MKITDDTRFEVKGAKFSTLAAAIDHATRTYSADALPTIMRSDLDSDGLGREWTEEYRCPSGDGACYDLVWSIS